MSARVHSLNIRRAAEIARPVFMFGTPDERALEWDFRMFNALLHDPQYDPGLRDGVMTVVIPQDDPAVANLNLRAAREAERRGESVIYRYIASDGRALSGTEYRFTVDVSDTTWGTEPRVELDGLSARQLRARFTQALAESQRGDTVGFQYDNIFVLNGVRIYLLDEPEPGIFACLAFDRAPE